MPFLAPLGRAHNALVWGAGQPPPRGFFLPLRGQNMDHIQLITDSDDFATPAGRTVRYAQPQCIPRKPIALHCWLHHSRSGTFRSAWLKRTAVYRSLRPYLRRTRRHHWETTWSARWTNSCAERTDQLIVTPTFRLPVGSPGVSLKLPTAMVLRWGCQDACGLVQPAAGPLAGAMRNEWRRVATRSAGGPNGVLGR